MASLAVLLVLAAGLPQQAAWAQSTTARITGRVVDETGEALPGVNVIAIHEPTGTRYGAATNLEGRYNLQGLRLGGPYSVTASFVGYQSVREEGVFLRLNETRPISFALEPKTEELEAVEVVAQRNPVIDKTRTGAGINVSEEEIQRLPTIARSLGEFARLVPQAGGYGGDLSFGGRNNRFNNIQIDGATFNDVFGLGDATPGSQAGAQPISLDAIAEFNIDIAPYDVRNANFTGGQINAVTKSGTNEFSGLFRFQGGNENFTGDLDGEGTSEFNQGFYVLNLGGPIVKDELFFFVNAELRRESNPVNTVVSDDPGALNAFSISPEELETLGFESTDAALGAIAEAAREVYGFDVGGFAPLSRREDNEKLLVKLDWNATPTQRATFRYNFLNARDDDGLGRDNDNFDFQSTQYVFRNRTHSFTGQLNSTFGDALFNEARVTYTRIRDERDIGDAAFPSTEFDINDSVELGPGRFNQANRLDQDLVELTNNLTYLRGNHTLTAGTNNQFFRFSNLFIQDFFGTYEFSGFTAPDGTFITPIEAFRRGQPSRYQFSYATPAAGTDRPEADFSAFQLGFYLQDEWQATDRLRLTGGLRVDVPFTPQEPTENATAVDVFGLSTSEVATGNPLWSPRLGFNYSLPTNYVGEGLTMQIRGGTGLFAGAPPFVWISNQFSNTGADLFRIDQGFDPGEDFYGEGTGPEGERFIPTDIGQNPTAQPRPGEGNVLAPIETTEINLIDPDFDYPQVWRTNVAIDQELPNQFAISLEGIYSKSVNEPLYRNLNIGRFNPDDPTDPLPTSTSRYGRPIYDARVDERFTNALYLTNTDQGYDYSLTVQLQRRAVTGLNGQLSYTYSDARNVNNVTSSRAISNWQFNENRDINNPRMGDADFLTEHRILAALNYRLEYLDRFATTLGLVYDGRSGEPFSWIYRGNANADTRDDNDLVYVPAAEDDIVLTSDNWDLMNSFIESEASLEEARGTIVRRNTARAPWQHVVDLRLTQEVLTFRGQSLEITFDMQNVLNWLNDDWGRQRRPSFNNVQAWNFDRYVSPDDVGTEVGGRVLTTDDVGKPVVSFPEETVRGRLTDDLFNLQDIFSRWRMRLGVVYRY